MKKSLQVFSGFFVLAVVLSVPVTEAAQAVSKPWPSLIGFATTAAGSGGHQVTVAAARMMTKYLKGVTVREIPLAAPLEALRTMNAGDAMFSFASSGTAHTTNRGIFGSPKIPLNLMFNGGTVYIVMMVLKDAGIKSVADLKGRTFVGEYFASANPATRMMMGYLHAYGLTEKNLTILKGMDHAEMIRPVIEGMAAGCMLPGPTPIAAATELTNLRNVDVLGVDEDKIDAALKHAASLGSFYARGVLKAGSYKGQTEDKIQAAGYSSFGVKPDAPEDLVYAVMKAIFDHEKEFKELQAAQRKVGIEMAIADPTTPYHPGAIRYYKERGLWTAGHDARQRALLKELGPEFDAFGVYR